MKPLEPHPFAELLPPMSDLEYSALKANLAVNGQLEDVVLFEGKILDGRHRYRALRELKIQPRTRDFEGAAVAAMGYVCSRAVHRHLNQSQKAVVALNFLPHLESQAEERMKAGITPIAQFPEGKACDLAGEMMGVSGRYVWAAKRLREHSLKRLKDVFEGRLTISAASNKSRGDRRRIELHAKAEAAPRVGTCEIVAADCIAELENRPARSFRLAFWDPPYNIGKDYGRGKNADRLTPEKYLTIIQRCVEECHRTLTPDGTLWVMICHEWAADFEMILRAAGFTIRSWVTWYETFGQNVANGFNRTSRRLFYCVKDPENYVFHREAFSRKSDRQLKYDDPRANPAGKLWDDVWQIPRLVGNATEVLQGDFETQLPLALVEPIVLGCSDPGDAVLDPFTGSGTTAVAACVNGRRFTGFEQNTKRAIAADQRVRAAVAERSKETRKTA